MKKSILLVAIGLLLVNGCSNKTVTAKSVTPKVNKTKVSKTETSKKTTSKKTTSKKVIKHTKWGAPTISEADAAKLFGFSVDDK